MRIIAAYLMAVLGGNENPTAADVTEILDAVGIKADAAELEKTLADLQGKNLDELIASGSKSLLKVTGGGGGGAAAAGSAPAAAGGGGGGAAAPAPEPEPEEEVMVTSFVQKTQIKPLYFRTWASLCSTKSSQIKKKDGFVFDMKGTIRSRQKEDEAGAAKRRTHCQRSQKGICFNGTCGSICPSDRLEAASARCRPCLKISKVRNIETRRVPLRSTRTLFHDSILA